MSLRTRNYIYGGTLVVLAGFFACAPMLLGKRDGVNLSTQAGPLTGSQIMRGAYLNTGSRDAGVDPDWDNGRYIGTKGAGAAFAPSAADIAEARARLEARKAALGIPPKQQQ